MKRRPWDGYGKSVCLTLQPQTPFFACPDLTSYEIGNAGNGDGELWAL